MTCPNCNINTVFTHPFMRMDKPGPKAKGVFWCEPCVKKTEPELYKNQKEDETQVEKELKDICY